MCLNCITHTNTTLVGLQKFMGSGHTQRGMDFVLIEIFFIFSSINYYFYYEALFTLTRNQPCPAA